MSSHVIAAAASTAVCRAGRSTRSSSQPENGTGRNGCGESNFNKRFSKKAQPSPLGGVLRLNEADMDLTQRDRLRDDLRGTLDGEILLDDLHCGLYATDASLFEVPPLAVIRPRTEADVQAVVRY